MADSNALRMTNTWEVWACPVCGQQRGPYGLAPCEGEDWTSSSPEATHEAAEIQRYEIDATPYLSATSESEEP